MTPATKQVGEPIRFIWYEDDGTIKAKIEGYIDSQNDVKFIDHNSVEYIGRFVAVEPIWLVGVQPDTYDIIGTFEQMPGLA